MQKYGQTKKQDEIKELEKKQAALLQDLPERKLAAQQKLEESQCDNPDCCRKE